MKLYEIGLVLFENAIKLFLRKLLNIISKAELRMLIVNFNETGSTMDMKKALNENGLRKLLVEESDDLKLSIRLRASRCSISKFITKMCKGN